MTRRTIHPRTLLVIVSLLTVFLLAGSYILNRIVFKAEPVSSALFFSPQLSNVGINQEFITAVKTSLDKPAWIAAAEFSVTYDENFVRPIDYLATPGWETQKISATGNVVHWALLPSQDRGNLVNLNGEQTIAQIKWKALKKGTQTLEFEPTTTMIMAVDAENSPSLYNAIASYQDSIITIAESGTSTTPVDFKLADNTASPSTSSGTQRIVSLEAVGGIDTAAVMASLKYPARVKVEFGLTDKLEGNVEVQKISSRFLVKIAGLQPNSTYYYRLVVDDSQGTTRYNSSMKTFKTSVAATGQAIDLTKSQLVVFPTSTQQTANALAILRNADGQILSDLAPTFTATAGQVKISQPSRLGGINFVEVTNSLGTRQAVRLAVSAAGQTIGEDAIVIDPNLADPVEPSYEETDALPWTRQTGLLVGGLVILALFSGLSLMKAARVK